MRNDVTNGRVGCAETGSRADASSPAVSTKGFDPARVEIAARAIAAHKRKLPSDAPEVDRVWAGYCGQARAVLTADDSTFAQENADLLHDLERQMTIANIECNVAEEYRELLETALPYVDSMASAQSMVDGFGEKRARQSDVDARAIRIALGADLPPLAVDDLLRPALTDADFASMCASADTHPEGGDSTEIEAPFMSGAVPRADEADAQTQSPPSRD